MICKNCKASDILGTTITTQEINKAKLHIVENYLPERSLFSIMGETTVLMALIMRMDEHIDRLEEEVARLAEAERRREELKGEG